ESPLVRSSDPTHVVCRLSFNRIVVAGLHVHSGNSEPIRIYSIRESRADAQIHMSLKRHPHILHSELIKIDDVRMDTWIQGPNARQVNGVDDTIADQVRVAEDQSVRSLIDLACRAGQDILAVIIPGLVLARPHVTHQHRVLFTFLDVYS